MARLVPLLTAVVLVALSGLVPGRWLHRAISTKPLQAATARLGLLPETIGDWTAEPASFDERGLDRMGISGLVARRYQNRRTGESVTILLVCGRPGPITVHGPETCYAGAGYQQSTPIVKRTIGGGEFWMSHFCKPSPIAGPVLRIYWAWSAGDRWRAPERPRLEYSEYDILYKLYLLCDVMSPGERDQDDPCRDFAGELVTALGRVVSPGR